MLDCIKDALIDTLKLLPYLFITFILLEFFEHKLSKNNEKILRKNQKYGPIIGSLLGALPQCGFSSMAANLFSSKIITMGTLIAVFLSTSDEMIAIMISSGENILTLLEIIGFKIIIGIIIGFIIDKIFKNKNSSQNAISKICEDDHCSCDKDGILLSSIKHVFKIGIFILVITIIINLIIFYFGEDSISKLLLSKNIYAYFLSSLIGLIPNCASSIIITKLYLSNLITIGTLISGLLTGSGIGILLLFKTNKNLKENFLILSIIYFFGVVIGIIVDMVL